MRNSILIEDRIIMFLIQLGNGNGLQLVGDIFEVTKGTISMIVKEFCHMVRLNVRKLFMQFLNEFQFKVLSKEFEFTWNFAHH
jgi:hypothetical protein